MTNKKSNNDDVQLVGAIDQGTSSSRFLVGDIDFTFSLICFAKIFNAANLQLITYHQESIKSLTPNPGWVEQDPYEILNKTILCMEKAVEQLEQLGYHKSNIKGREIESNIGHLTHNLKHRLFSHWRH